MHSLSWDTVEVNTGGGENTYLNLQPGVTVVRVASDPITFKKHWYEDHRGTKAFIAPKDGDPLIARGETPSKRYVFKVLHDEGGKGSTPLMERPLKALEVGPLIFNEIAKFAKDEDYGVPFNYDLKIEKSGSGMNGTNYVVTPRPIDKCEKFTKEVKKRVEDLDMNLEAMFPAATPQEINDYINEGRSSKSVDDVIEEDIFSDSDVPF